MPDDTTPDATPDEAPDPEVTDPGVTDPGVTDPGVTDPGVAVDDERPRRSTLSAGGWARLVGRQFGVVGDTYLAVTGAALVALGLAVVLDAFGVLSIGFEGSTGANLGAGLVIGVLGLFALGVASEGPMTGPVVAWPDLELVVARVAAVVVVSTAGVLAADALADPAATLGYPFELGVRAVAASAQAGFFVALPVGVGGGWALRAGFDVPPGWDRVVLLAAWTLGTWGFLAAAIP